MTVTTCTAWSCSTTLQKKVKFDIFKIILFIALRSPLIQPTLTNDQIHGAYYYQLHEHALSL